MSAKKNCQYSRETLSNALEAIKNGMPIKTASRDFKIPKTTLHYKFHGKYPLECKAGAPTILTKEEEVTLVEWIIRVAQVGFPVSREQLLESVCMLLTKKKRPNPFENNLPGRHWYEGFLRRHPEVSRRMTQNLVHARAIITEQSIRKWFREVKKYLEDHDLMEVLNDPRRTFNADETAFFLCPKGKKALALKGSKTVYNKTANDEKECITTLITANAAGDLPPPMVIFSYQRIPQSIVALMPDKWGLGRSESGWMTGETFFEYISNVFHPWLVENNIPLPVIFYVDGHKSHLTLNLSEFCSQNGIVLVSLFPNSTHILQSMDVGVFHPLKNGWKKAVAMHRIKSNTQKIRKEHFAPLLDSVIKEVVNVNMLRNAFKTCGLFPFDDSAINYNKLVTAAINAEVSAERIDSTAKAKSEPPEFNNQHLKFIEGFIANEKVKEFQTCFSTISGWTGDLKDESLFILWSNLKKHVEKNKPKENQAIDDVPADAIVLEADWLEELLFENEGINMAESLTTITDIEENRARFPSIETTNGVNDLGEEEDGQNTTEIFNVEAVSGVDDSSGIEKTEQSIAGIPSSNAINVIDDIVNEDRNKQNRIGTPSIETTGVTVDLGQEERDEQSIAGSSSVKTSMVGDFDNEEKNEQTSMLGDLNKEEQNEQSNCTVRAFANKTNALPFTVPSPFKNILFWPEKETIEKKKKISVKVPSVASSEQWKAYYKSKQEAKDQKEEEKENRKRKREENRQETLQKKTARPKREEKSVKRKVFTPEKASEESSEESMTSGQNNIEKNKDFKVGEYVIVNYENKKFPGVIISMKQDEAFVNAMTPSRMNWKWPAKKDELWYNCEDICEKIKEPILCNNNRRGIFVVPEMEKYQEF